ncbi:hypothetical protein BH11GEM2_BH11GEM2_36230 [soil metagenome]
MSGMLSRPRALAALRALGRSLEGVSVVDVRDQVSNDLYQSLLHHFGSLDEARIAAGVGRPKPKNKRWTKEAVVAGLHRARRAGIRLTHQGLIAAGLRGLANAAGAYCGGLPRARKLAGLADPGSTVIERLAWDEDTVVSDIRALHRGRKSLAYTKAPSKLVNAAARRFGTWRGAVEAAGLDYDRVRLVREPYDQEELLSIMRDIHTHAPETTLAELHDHLANEAWKREFGSIEDAARAAGLHDWPVRVLGPLLEADGVIAAIRAAHRNGRSLASSHVDSEDSHLHKSALRRFGSWHDALIAAGLPAPAIQKATGLRRTWTKTAIRDALRSRRRSGKSMSPSVLREEDPPLYQAAKSHLGYDAEMAIREWGAPRLQTTWTKQAVIEALRENRGERVRAAVGLAAVNLFGSMIAARKAATVPILRTMWTDQRVIDEIRALDGERPSGTLVSIAQRRFGSWRAALEAAGGVPQTRRWDAASLTQALRARIEKHEPLDGTTVRREDPSLFFAVEHRFGDYDRLVAKFVDSGRLPERGQRRRA